MALTVLAWIPSKSDGLMIMSLFRAILGSGHNGLEADQINLVFRYNIDRLVA